MQKLFNLDGPIFVFLSKVANLVILNLLWILCSLPIFTIGASTSALSYSTIRMTNGYDDKLCKNFFKGFKKTFKKSTIIWLIMLLVGLLIGFDMYFFYNVKITGGRVLFYIMLPFAAIYLFVLLYIFAIETIFDNSIKNSFKNAFYFSISNLPSTLIMFVGIGIITKISFTSLSFFSQYGFIFWVFIGFGFLSYITAFFFDRAFKPNFEEEEYEKIFFE